MKLFKKHHAPARGTLTGRTAIYLDRQQRKAADYLNHKTKHLPKRAILYSLFIFVLIVGAYLLSLIILAF